MQKQIFIFGFSIFSMFFGSGNLVFPLKIGVETGPEWLPAFFGLMITGIILPFLGLFVIKIYKGNYEAFFGEAGSIAKFFLPFFTLSLLGAFGVVPRCITVAHGGIEYIFPQLSLSIFSLIFCITSFIICLNEHFMISIMGKYLTPILLACLIILIMYGVINSEIITHSSNNIGKSFGIGFFQGYETMDLFAAFFFSSLVFKQIQAFLPSSTNETSVLVYALKTSLIGAILLSIIYLGFVFLGAHYNHILIQSSPELFLPTLAAHLMGNNSSLIISLIVIFSCLTTAVALNNIYAKYLHSLLKLKKELFPLMLFITTTTAFFISLLDFRGIAGFLAPILEITYPSLISLTLFTIFLKNWHKMKIFSFYGIIITMLVYKFF